MSCSTTTRRLLALVVAAAAALGGCDDGGSSSSSKGSTIVDTTTVPTTQLPVPSPEAPRSVVDERPTGITGYVVRDDGETLLLVFTSGTGSCGVLGRVQVNERDDAVVVTVFVGNEPSIAAGDSCTADGRIAAVVATLAAPLGDRAVLDGRETPPRPVALVV